MSTDTELTEDIFLEDDIEDDVFIDDMIIDNHDWNDNAFLENEVLLFPEELNEVEQMPIVQENIQFAGINVVDEGVDEEIGRAHV